MLCTTGLICESLLLSVKRYCKYRPVGTAGVSPELSTVLHALQVLPSFELRAATVSEVLAGTSAAQLSVSHSTDSPASSRQLSKVPLVTNGGMLSRASANSGVPDVLFDR